MTFTPLTSITTTTFFFESSLTDTIDIFVLGLGFFYSLKKSSRFRNLRLLFNFRDPDLPFRPSSFAGEEGNVNFLFNFSFLLLFSDNVEGRQVFIGGFMANKLN